MPIARPLSNILVKPAGPDCNMACDYCFYSKKHALFAGTAAHRMTDEVLERTIRRLMDQQIDAISIGWQGGEPTLMGLAFFERAVELQKRYGASKTVGNGLQTNGILLDDKWARFFREYSFLVGLSIDGPGHVHDRYRRGGGGGGTWRQVADVAKRMLDAGVSVNALTVVNDYSAGFAEEIYAHHKGLGLSFMQFIPCVEKDPENPGALAPFSVSAEGYGEFLCTVFDLWRADFVDGAPTTSIRFFESLLFAYAGFGPPECTLSAECGSYVVVEHNGDVYSCDFFVEPAWRLGNVMTDDLVAMANSSRQLEFGRLKSRLPDACKACTYLSICRGGCTKDRVHNPQDPKVNYLCGALMRFFDHADAELRKLVAEWREKQGERPHARVEARAGVGRNEPCPCGSGKKYKKCCGRA